VAFINAPHLFCQAMLILTQCGPKLQKQPTKVNTSPGRDKSSARKQQKLQNWNEAGATEMSHSQHGRRGPHMLVAYDVIDRLAGNVQPRPTHIHRVCPRRRISRYISSSDERKH